MEKEKFQAENQQQAFSKRNIPLTALVFATFATFCTTLFFNYASNYPSLGKFTVTLRCYISINSLLMSCPMRMRLFRLI